MTASIEELYRRSVTFPGPTVRMLGLEEVRGALEEQLDVLSNQRRVRLDARLKRDAHAMAEDDIEHLRYQLQRTVDELFPKVFRGGFIIYLWTVFESCINDLADYVRRERNVPFGLQELRAPDFLKQMDLFFSRVLQLPAFPDQMIRAKLAELKDLRSALVHHDGDVDQIPRSLRGKTPAEYERKGLLLYRDLHHEYGVPTAEFARRSLDTVRTYLETFAGDVYARVHPVPLDDSH
jgi:hypothetical protein